MTASDALKNTWSAVALEASGAPGCYHRRIPLACSWPAHAGIHRPTDARLLILESEAKSVHGLRPKGEAKGYSITVDPDETGRRDRVTIRIQEVTTGFREIFTIFCADILEHWVPHAEAADALKSLTARLARWRRFFQRGTLAGLGREEYVGLYGELSLIEAGLAADLDPANLVGAWQGPSGTNQDFLLGPDAVEVKTTTGNEIDKVRITNARQLDSTGVEALFLAHYVFDFRQDSGRTLPQLIHSLRTTLAVSSIETLSTLNDRLLDAGFLDGTPNEHDSWGFTPRHSAVFAVGATFPRVLESGLPQGVSEISYTLNLSTAAAFQITHTDFWTHIHSSYA